MRNNLIPTAVMDKNGKQTTVHKKAIDAPADKSLPAPVASHLNQSSSADIEAYDSETGGKLYELMEKLNKRELGQDKIFFVMRASNRQRKLYLELLEKNDGFWDVVNAATGAAVKNNKSPGTSQMEAIALLYDKDLFTVSAAEPKARKARMQYLKLDGYMQAISNAYRDPAVRSVRDWKSAVSIADAAPETIEEMRSYTKLLSAVRELDPQHHGPLKELSEFALNGKHSTDDVVAVMKKHQTRDINVIDGILNGTSPSIANGWL